MATPELLWGPEALSRSLDQQFLRTCIGPEKHLRSEIAASPERGSSQGFRAVLEHHPEASVPTDGDAFGMAFEARGRRYACLWG
jgi:hypothetical protein